ncbi:MAG: RNA methyltransferase [Bacteroidetes bacterium]|nr:RNA methyltransferase [Bacteroidota bacterium]
MLLSQAKLKVFSALHLKKVRQAEGLYLAPGEKLLQEVLQRGMRPEAVIADPGFIPRLPQALPCPVYEATGAQLRRISGHEQPEGVVTVLPLPACGKLDAGLSTLFLHGIQDPGNLGTLLRTAAWFGIEQVLCDAACADAYNPKAVRASMGAVFSMAIRYVPDLSEELVMWPGRILAADLQGMPLSQWQPLPSDHLLLGSESHGIPPALLAIPHVSPVHIPGSGLQESLNVAVAGGILMAHWKLAP